MTRVALRKGKSGPYKQALLEGIYQAMRTTCHIGDGDRFMSITEHEASEFAYGENYLGIQRSDDLVQIQIFWSPGKTVPMKQALYKEIVELLGRNPGVRPEDCFICVFEAPAENWSFGNGETQFYRAQA
jgi:phenylpyruvate tautomerase PptA (4-oxalocrotonate tautomerase family)